MSAQSELFAELRRLREESEQARRRFEIALCIAQKEGVTFRELSEAVGMSTGALHSLVARHREPSDGAAQALERIKKL